MVPGFMKQHRASEEPFMRLVIEYIGRAARPPRDQCGPYEMNGDLCQDSEMSA